MSTANLNAANQKNYRKMESYRFFKGTQCLLHCMACFLALNLLLPGALSKYRSMQNKRCL